MRKGREEKGKEKKKKRKGEMFTLPHLSSDFGCRSELFYEHEPLGIAYLIACYFFWNKITFVQKRAVGAKLFGD